MATPDRSERLRALFHELLALGPEDRAARLTEVADELRVEVESLLAAADAPGSEVRRALQAFRPAEGGAEESDPRIPLGDPPAGLRKALADRYTLEHEIGRGGMATVYLADDLKHERKVAVKVLKPELAATVGSERFLQEVHVTASLQHPHILPLFDSGEAGGFLYYVMPFVEGESLRERLARERELPVAEALQILREVTDALATAHGHGVVHRDIKPGNILLSGRHAMVSDFGVAKAVSEATAEPGLTSTGVSLGTPAYMAPEQAAGDVAVDHRADIYAVGVLAYELLAGRPPFTGPSRQNILTAQVMEVPRDVTELCPRVPSELAAVVMRCLEKKPKNRWESAEQLLAEFQSVGTPSDGVTPYRIARVWRHRVVRRSVASGFVLVALGLGGRWILGRGDDLVTDVGVSAVRGDAAAEVEPGFVVVPFENQSGVESLGDFGGMLADYLTAQISRHSVAWVTPASSVRDLARQRPTDADVVAYYAASTGARYVVRGSYVPRGETLVIHAEVTDGTTSELISTVGPMNGPVSDFSEAVRRSTDQILGVLASIADPESTWAPPRSAGQPRSFTAYRDYVTALELLGQAERSQALELLYRAVAADSTYAEALLMAASMRMQDREYATADSLLRVAERYRADLAPWDETFLDFLQGYNNDDLEAVWRAARRYEDLDPVRGGDCQGARVANRLEKAVEYALKRFEWWADQPLYLEYWWGDLLGSLHSLGEHEIELEYARIARQKHPDSRLAFSFEVQALAALDRIDEIRLLMAEAEDRADQPGWEVPAVLRRVEYDLRPHGHIEFADSLAHRLVEWCETQEERSAQCGRALYRIGEVSGARSLFEDLVADDPDNKELLGWLGTVAAGQGDRDTALALSDRLRELGRRPHQGGGATRWRAAIVAELGDRRSAVALLEEAYGKGRPYGMWLRHQYQHRSLQGYPPFERFMEPKG